MKIFEYEFFAWNQLSSMRFSNGVAFMFYYLYVLSNPGRAYDWIFNICYNTS